MSISYRIRVQFIAVSLSIFLLWLTFTSVAVSSPLTVDIGSQSTATEPIAIKTYFLNVLPEGGRREVKIDPPATQVAVTSQSGDTTVRCGDAANNYSCSPGKRLELTYDSAHPLVKFWAENTTETLVRLQIDVYQITMTESNSITIEP